MIVTGWTRPDGDGYQAGCGLEAEKEGLKRQNEAILKRLAHETGDDFDILGGGAEQALLADTSQTSHLGVAMSMQLFGVGETAFHGFLSPLIDRFPALHQSVHVDPFLAALPHMARHDFDLVCALCALL